MLNPIKRNHKIFIKFKPHLSNQPQHHISNKEHTRKKDPPKSKGKVYEVQAPQEYQKSWGRFFDYEVIPKIVDVEYTAKAAPRNSNMLFLTKNLFKFTFFEILSTIIYREIARYMFEECVFKSLFYFIEEKQTNGLNINDKFIYQQMQQHPILDYQDIQFSLCQYINLHMEQSNDRSLYFNLFIIWKIKDYFQQMDTIQKLNFILFMDSNHLVDTDYLKILEKELKQKYQQNQQFLSNLKLIELKRLINLVHFYQTHYGKQKSEELLSEQLIQDIVQSYLQNLQKHNIVDDNLYKDHIMNEVVCYNLQFVDKDAYQKYLQIFMDCIHPQTNDTRLGYYSKIKKYYSKNLFYTERFRFPEELNLILDHLRIKGIFYYFNQGRLIRQKGVFGCLLDTSLIYNSRHEISSLHLLRKMQTILDLHDQQNLMVSKAKIRNKYYNFGVVSTMLDLFRSNFIVVLQQQKNQNTNLDIVYFFMLVQNYILDFLSVNEGGVDQTLDSLIKYQKSGQVKDLKMNDIDKLFGVDSHNSVHNYFDSKQQSCVSFEDVVPTKQIYYKVYNKAIHIIEQDLKPLDRTQNSNNFYDSNFINSVNQIFQVLEMISYILNIQSFVKKNFYTQSQYLGSNEEQYLGLGQFQKDIFAHLQRISEKLDGIIEQFKYYPKLMNSLIQIDWFYKTNQNKKVFSKKVDQYLCEFREEMDQIFRNANEQSLLVNYMEELCRQKGIERLEKDILLDHHFLLQKVRYLQTRYPIGEKMRKNKKDGDFKQKVHKDYLLEQFSDKHVSNRGNYLMNQMITECVLNESVLKKNIEMMLDNIEGLEYEKNVVEFPFMMDFVVQYQKEEVYLMVIDQEKLLIGGYNVIKQSYQDCYHYYKYIKQVKVVRFYSDEYNIDIGTMLKYITCHNDYVSQKKTLINQNGYEALNVDNKNFQDYCDAKMNVGQNMKEQKQQIFD